MYLDGNLSSTLNASGLAAGEYKVCYVQRTWAGNATVTPQTLNPEPQTLNPES
jgi:hypothetical protein